MTRGRVEGGLGKELSPNEQEKLKQERERLARQQLELERLARERLVQERERWQFGRGRQHRRGRGGG